MLYGGRQHIMRLLVTTATATTTRRTTVALLVLLLINNNSFMNSAKASKAVANSYATTHGWFGDNSIGGQQIPNGNAFVYSGSNPFLSARSNFGGNDDGSGLRVALQRDINGLKDSLGGLLGGVLNGVNKLGGGSGGASAVGRPNDSGGSIYVAASSVNAPGCGSSNCAGSVIKFGSRQLGDDDSDVFVISDVPNSGGNGGSGISVEVQQPGNGGTGSAVAYVGGNTYRPQGSAGKPNRASCNGADCQGNQENVPSTPQQSLRPPDLTYVPPPQNQQPPSRPQKRQDQQYNPQQQQQNREQYNPQQQQGNNGGTWQPATNANSPSHGAPNNWQTGVNPNPQPACSGPNCPHENQQNLNENHPNGLAGGGAPTTSTNGKTNGITTGNTIGQRRPNNCRFGDPCSIRDYGQPLQPQVPNTKCPNGDCPDGDNAYNGDDWQQNSKDGDAAASPQAGGEGATPQGTFGSGPQTGRGGSSAAPQYPQNNGDEIADGAINKRTPTQNKNVQNLFLNSPKTPIPNRPNNNKAGADGSGGIPSDSGFATAAVGGCPGGICFSPTGANFLPPGATGSFSSSSSSSSSSASRSSFHSTNSNGESNSKSYENAAASASAYMFSGRFGK